MTKRRSCVTRIRPRARTGHDQAEQEADRADHNRYVNRRMVVRHARMRGNFGEATQDGTPLPRRHQSTGRRRAPTKTQATLAGALHAGSTNTCIVGRRVRFS